MNSFKLKQSQFRANRNNNTTVWQELDKIEVCPNNLVNLVSGASLSQTVS
jgi:hypothetical protein